MTGLKAVVNVSSQLAKVVGGTKMSRTDVTKKVWSYIKQHDLQDPKDRREINCDAPLKQVFETDKVHMLKMPGLLQKHLTKP